MVLINNYYIFIIYKLPIKKKKKTIKLKIFFYYGVLITNQSKNILYKVRY